MSTSSYLLSLIIIAFGSLTSCGQPENLDDQVNVAMNVNDHAEAGDQQPHSFGGWYCPDNLRGFPPMDIRDLDKVPVVTGRLPTREETGNGTSLMYVDLQEHPDAKPLAMHLPRVATMVSPQNGMTEQVIVIQAIVVGRDTVVGYRFPSGGNGSARFREVTFLTDQEVKALGSAPMVYLHTDIQAPREAIWQAMTHTKYLRDLAETFNQKEFFSSDWTEGAEVRLLDEKQGEKAIGIVATVFGNVYLHIDYDRDGVHATEKVLLLENREAGTTELHLVSGPHQGDIHAQTEVWEQWIKEVKLASEKQ